MAIHSKLLELALQHHQEGRLGEAAEFYRQVLRLEPDNADALHLHGLVAHQTGNHAAAVDLISRAIRVKPNVAVFHHNLAAACVALNRIPEAVACYRRAIEIKPTFADAHRNLGDVFHDLGRLDEAIACYQRTLELTPDDAEGHNNLGNTLREQGRLEEAVVSYRRALKLRPDLCETHMNLGIVLHDQGEFDAAIASYRQALALKPVYAEAEYNLGNALASQGKLNDAVACYRQALEWKPNYAEALNSLGIALQQLWQPEEAAACYRRALELNPNNPRTYNNLGNALRDQWKLDEAVASYRRALELNPDYASVFHNLGNTLKDLQKFEEAAKCYRRALELDPGLAETHSGLGLALRDLGQADGAMACFSRALELKPDFADAHYHRAQTLKDWGKLDEAIAGFRRTLELDPQNLAALAGVATALRKKLPDADLSYLEHLLLTPQLPTPHRIRIEFALAQVYDARGAYLRAAEYLIQANRHQHESYQTRYQTYDAVEYHNHITQLIDTFTPAYFNSVSGWGNPSERPVFIVGMPRSGTTLTEQILASHPRIHGAGECFFAARSLERLTSELRLQSPIDCLQHITPEAIHRTAEWHLGRLNEVAGSEPLRVVDKMPDNYQLLGWIATLFPKAKIIHCRRDMRDVALSCWITNFGRIRWSNDLEHLASRILDYQRIMAHYQTVLPMEMFVVDYEEMVADQEGLSRRLLDFVGLDWDPACLDFHQTPRAVRTASVTQVRQPIYSSSVGRWQHYATALAPLLDRLESSGL